MHLGKYHLYGLRISFDIDDDSTKKSVDLVGSEHMDEWENQPLKVYTSFY